MITMTVPPRPVLVLLLGASLAPIAMLAVAFHLPLAVIAVFVWTPAMIIMVVRVIDASISVLGATAAQQRQGQRRSQQEGNEVSTSHWSLLCVAHMIGASEALPELPILRLALAGKVKLLLTVI
jgi:choline-glycine betaine transporter